MQEPAAPQRRKPPASDATGRQPWLAAPGVAAAPRLSAAGHRRALVEPQPKPRLAVVRAERVRFPHFVGAHARPRLRCVSFRWLAERLLPPQSLGHSAVPILCWVGSFLASRALLADQDNSTAQLCLRRAVPQSPPGGCKCELTALPGLPTSATAPTLASSFHAKCRSPSRPAAFPRPGALETNGSVCGTHRSLA